MQRPKLEYCLEEFGKDSKVRGHSCCVLRAVCVVCVGAFGVLSLMCGCGVCAGVSRAVRPGPHGAAPGCPWVFVELKDGVVDNNSDV